MVLHVLEENQLLSKYSKCEFCLRFVVYHGHIISSDELRSIKGKNETLKNWPRLLTPTNITSFLGLEGSYRRFVDGFASSICPLITLTQKSVKFMWSEECERSFQVLKERLTSTAVFTLPEGTKGFVVYCDAS